MMNWILVVMAGLAAMVIAMLVGGLVTPAQYTVRRRIALAASPERVREVLGHALAWPVWTERALNVAVGDARPTEHAVAHAAAPARLHLEVTGDELRRDGSFDLVVHADGAGSVVECTEVGRIGDPLQRFLRTHLVGLAGHSNAVLRCLAEQLDEFDRVPEASGADGGDGVAIADREDADFIRH